MPVLIGSARINEFGDVYGGEPGDQNGQECAIENWYLHKDGWVVIRAKDEEARLKIAQDMRYICNNDYIGYDWDRMYTLYQYAEKVGFDASKVNKPCDTNCAKAVRVCIRYAGIWCEDFYTGDEIQKLEKTGKFYILTDPKYCKSSDYLREGDILVTPVQGHTVVVLTNGAAIKDVKTYPYKVVNNDVWIRQGPSTQYDTIKIAPRGAIVHVYYKEGNWARVVFEGTEGFASLKYLESLSKWYEATNDVWFRATPGILGRKIFSEPVYKGTVLEGVGRTSSILGTTWYEVHYRGEIGWCSGKYLKNVH